MFIRTTPHPNDIPLLFILTGDKKYLARKPRKRKRAQVVYSHSWLGDRAKYQSKTKPKKRAGRYVPKEYEAIPIRTLSDKLHTFGNYKGAYVMNSRLHKGVKPDPNNFRGADFTDPSNLFANVGRDANVTVKLPFRQKTMEYETT